MKRTKSTLSVAKWLLVSTLICGSAVVFTSCGSNPLEDVIGAVDNPTPSEPDISVPTATIKFLAKNEYQDPDNYVTRDVKVAKLTLKSSCLPNGKIVFDEQITSPASSVTVSIPHPPSGENIYEVIATDADGFEWKADFVFLTLNEGTNPDKEIVFFSPYHYPLTIEAKEAGATVTFNLAHRDGDYTNPSSSPECRTFNGSTWSEWAAYSAAIVLTNVGDKVQFRGNNATYSAIGSDGEPGDNSCFAFTADCYVYGNIMSLISSQTFSASTPPGLGNSAFYGLFQNNTHLLSNAARSLVLPATTLEHRCYECMFQGCTSLIVAPVLPATTLGNHCYNNMFDDCTSLMEVTCLATVVGDDNTSDWLNNVPDEASRTFYINATLDPTNPTPWTRDVKGIPSNWTVKTYTPAP